MKRWSSDLILCVGFVAIKDGNWKGNSKERVMSGGNTRVEREKTRVLEMFDFVKK